jgi:hypothetical protein
MKQISGFIGEADNIFRKSNLPGITIAKIAGPNVIKVFCEF